MRQDPTAHREAAKDALIAALSDARDALVTAAEWATTYTGSTEAEQLEIAGYAERVQLIIRRHEPRVYAEKEEVWSSGELVTDRQPIKIDSTDTDPLDIRPFRDES